MPLPPTSLERAFELASSGQCVTVREIRERLRQEGYDPGQIEGKSVVLQLQALMRKARGLGPPMITKAYQRNLKF